MRSLARTALASNAMQPLGSSDLPPQIAADPVLMQAGNGMEPSADIYNRLLKNRIVFLGSEVNDTVANFITAQLLFLEGEDAEKDIWLYINSPGGSVTAGMAIYDTMQFITPDVGTICMGLSASMGQFLLCAGAPGKRYALPHARIMMHQPSAGMQGQASDIAIQAEQLKYIKDLLAERIAFHTGQTKDQINEDSDRDRWFTAEGAKEYGIIDHVIVRRGEMRCAARDPSRRRLGSRRRCRVIGPDGQPSGSTSSKEKSAKSSGANSRRSTRTIQLPALSRITASTP